MMSNDPEKKAAAARVKALLNEARRAGETLFDGFDGLTMAACEATGSPMNRCSVMVYDRVISLRPPTNAYLAVFKKLNDFAVSSDVESNRKLAAALTAWRKEKPDDDMNTMWAIDNSVGAWDVKRLLCLGDHKDWGVIEAVATDLLRLKLHSVMMADVQAAEALAYVADVLIESVTEED